MKPVKSYFLVFLTTLLTLIAHIEAHVHSMLYVCVRNDVKVDCIPSCPKLCVDALYPRRCYPQKCKRGCACKEGFVRRLSPEGMCIPRAECKRWIL
ncbi:SCO-spondin [Scaptodrosophila lebanonensis]|uniref:SCO-spondin n=1 Tax=Drosophila lebanonensis TaxID=7225 RepID=A0A6J2UIN4_DROLE|nr:SCO-spondin [Scaptodrosophila lebanonensis]